MPYEEESQSVDVTDNSNIDEFDLSTGFDISQRSISSAEAADPYHLSLFEELSVPNLREGSTTNNSYIPFPNLKTMLLGTRLNILLKDYDDIILERLFGIYRDGANHQQFVSPFVSLSSSAADTLRTTFNALIKFIQENNIGSYELTPKVAIALVAYNAFTEKKSFSTVKNRLVHLRKLYCHQRCSLNADVFSNYESQLKNIKNHLKSKGNCGISSGHSLPPASVQDLMNCIKDEEADLVCRLHMALMAKLWLTVEESLSMTFDLFGLALKKQEDDYSFMVCVIGTDPRKKPKNLCFKRDSDSTACFAGLFARYIHEYFKERSKVVVTDRITPGYGYQHISIALKMLYSKHEVHCAEVSDQFKNVFKNYALKEGIASKVVDAKGSRDGMPVMNHHRLLNLLAHRSDGRRLKRNVLSVEDIPHRLRFAHPKLKFPSDFNATEKLFVENFYKELEVIYYEDKFERGIFTDIEMGLYDKWKSRYDNELTSAVLVNIQSRLIEKEKEHEALKLEVKELREQLKLSKSLSTATTDTNKLTLRGNRRLRKHECFIKVEEDGIDKYKISKGLTIRDIYYLYYGASNLIEMEVKFGTDWRLKSQSSLFTMFLKVIKAVDFYNQVTGYPINVSIQHVTQYFEKPSKVELETLEVFLFRDGIRLTLAQKSHLEKIKRKRFATYKWNVGAISELAKLQNGLIFN